MLTPPRLLRTALLGLLAATASSAAMAQTAAIATDPAPDKAAPAAMQSFQLPSHGALLNAMVYIAAGAGPHPVVLLLHGFPGNERNLDLAQSLRRAGYDVLFFNYRGSWGSPGSFSFSNSLEDTLAAAAYLRDPAHAARLRADPKKILVIGHSMGGFMALNAAAADPALAGVVAISAADLGTGAALQAPADQHAALLAARARMLAAQGMAPLAGCTPEGLAAESMSHAAEWNFAALAPKLAARPLLVLDSDDGLAPADHALVTAVETAGGKAVKEVHIADDHSYSGHRIQLQQEILDFLAAHPELH